MSTAIRSMSNGVPFSTNGRFVLTPTYSDDGCTVIVVDAFHAWRLTSLTLAFAVTENGIDGFALRKSICSTCSPSASVLPAKFHVGGALYSPPPGYESSNQPR